MGIRHGAMSYLGIDASLEGTGLCLLCEDGSVKDMRTVRPGGLRGMARLALIKAAACELLRPMNQVRGAAIEGYAFGAVNQAFSLGEIGGILRLLMHEHEVPYVDVPPISLKKFATGSTHADKDDMIAAAKALGAQPEDDNQADAYHLAWLARAMALRPRLTRVQLEVVHQLTSPTSKKARRRPRRLVSNPV